jgi:hypothetical protein
VSDSELNGPLSDTEQGGEGTTFRYPAISAAITGEEVENAAFAAQSAGEPRTPQVMVRAPRPCMSVFCQNKFYGSGTGCNRDGESGIIKTKMTRRIKGKTSVRICNFHPKYLNFPL